MFSLQLTVNRTCHSRNEDIPSNLLPLLITRNHITEHLLTDMECNEVVVENQNRLGLILERELDLLTPKRETKKKASFYAEEAITNLVQLEGKEQFHVLMEQFKSLQIESGNLLAESKNVDESKDTWNHKKSAFLIF